MAPCDQGAGIDPARPAQFNGASIVVYFIGGSAGTAVGRTLIDLVGWAGIGLTATTALTIAASIVLLSGRTAGLPSSAAAEQVAGDIDPVLESLAQPPKGKHGNQGTSPGHQPGLSTPGNTIATALIHFASSLGSARDLVLLIAFGRLSPGPAVGTHANPGSQHRPRQLQAPDVGRRRGPRHPRPGRHPRRRHLANEDPRCLNTSQQAHAVSRLLTITGSSKKQSRSSESARELSSPARTRRYYARPDVAYVPVSDAPPLEWGPIPPADRNAERVRAFAAAANDLVHDHMGRHPG